MKIITFHPFFCVLQLLQEKKKNINFNNFGRFPRTVESFSLQFVMCKKWLFLQGVTVVVVVVVTVVVVNIVVTVFTVVNVVVVIIVVTVVVVIIVVTAVTVVTVVVDADAADGVVVEFVVVFKSFRFNYKIQSVSLMCLT